MKTIRNITILSLLFLFTICSFGQTTYVRAFTYDTNGDRIATEILFAKTRTDGSVDKEELLPLATDTLADVTMRIYPNPTNDMFFVSTSGNKTGGTIKATLISATGAVLAVKYLTDSEEGFDLAGEASGIYILEISNGKEKHVWKVVKQ